MAVVQITSCKANGPNLGFLTWQDGCVVIHYADLAGSMWRFTGLQHAVFADVLALVLVWNTMHVQETGKEESEVLGA